jgi:hypothetical protein
MHVSGGHWTYKVNSASFPPRLLGNSMNANQYLWWINFGISQWSERTGANIHGDYAGESTKLAQLNTSDGESTIVATTGCDPLDSPACTTLAYTYLYDVDGDGGDQSSWGTTPDYTDIAEADIVFFSGPSSPNNWQWSVQTNQVFSVSAQADVLGLAVHESGHAYGYAHTTNDVMTPTFSGQNAWRYPTGDDITGANAVYGNTAHPTITWAKRTTSGWTQVTTNALPGWTHQGPTAAIGAYNGTNASAVVVGIAGTDRLPYIAGAVLPLTASTVWTEFALSSTATTWRAPAIAARKSGTALWLAAWPNDWPFMCNLSGSSCSGGGTACPGATVAVSSDAFTTSQLYNIAGICTVNEIALTHDAQRDVFVMAYTKRSTTDQGTLYVANPINDSIVLRTSADGQTWSAETTVDVTSSGRHRYDIAGPGLACASSGACLLTWHADDSPDPTIVTAGFTVGSSGLPSSLVPTTTTCTDRTQRTLAAAATRYNNADYFLVNELYSTNPLDWAQSFGQSWTFEAASAPLPQGFCSTYYHVTGLASGHAPTIAGGIDLYTDTYIFWTN